MSHSNEIIPLENMIKEATRGNSEAIIDLYTVYSNLRMFLSKYNLINTEYTEIYREKIINALIEGYYSNNIDPGLKEKLHREFQKYAYVSDISKHEQNNAHILKFLPQGMRNLINQVETGNPNAIIDLISVYKNLYNVHNNQYMLDILVVHEHLPKLLIDTLIIAYHLDSTTDQIRRQIETVIDERRLIEYHIKQAYSYSNVKSIELLINMLDCLHEDTPERDPSIYHSSEFVSALAISLFDKSVPLNIRRKIWSKKEKIKYYKVIYHEKYDYSDQSYEPTDIIDSIESETFLEFLGKRYYDRLEELNLNP